MQSKQYDLLRVMRDAAARRARVRAFAENGKTPEEIAERMGMKVPAVKRIIKAGDTSEADAVKLAFVKTEIEQARERRKLITRMRKEDMTDAQIARALGVSRQMIHKLMNGG